MPAKIKFFKDIIQTKKNKIAWALIAPAFLVVFQLSAVLVAETYFTKSEAAGLVLKGDSGKPAVLGAATDARGGAAPALKAVAPIVPEEELAKVTAKSFLIYEAASGQVLAARNPEQKTAIASLTKLMTGLLAYENLDFSQKETIRRAGLTRVQPTVNFADGDEIAVADIFSALIVGSCNDAAEILSQAIKKETGQDTVKLMNERAMALGMNSTSFANPIGFDSASNYSTAKDLQKLINQTQSFGVFTNLGKTSQLDFIGGHGFSYHVKATNGLIKGNSDLYAIKTGFTAGARGAMATKVVKDNRDIIIIVLGSSDRELDTLELKKLVVDPLAWQ